MSRRRISAGHAVSFEALEPRVLLSGSVVISEFMAKNTSGLKDADGDYSDWVELYNMGASAVSLNHYYLTDSASNLAEWQFPDVTLPAGSFLVVFASGKDRHVAGQELHTNFQLSGSGEYLALVEPDAATIDFQYSPTFPAQYSNISYGLTNLGTPVSILQAFDAAKWKVPASSVDDATWMASSFNDAAWNSGHAAIGFDADVIGGGSVTQTLLDYGAPAYALVPTADIGTTWRTPSFTPTGWLTGTTGVGYEHPAGGGYDGVIGLNVDTQMYNKNQSCYIRVDFNLPADPSAVTQLTLSLRVDDGDVIWLNGNATPIHSAYAPGTLAWNSGAAGGPSDPAGYTDIDITAYKSQLVAGRNVLAIQGLNNGLTSSDFLVIPKVSATYTNITSDYAPLIQTDVQTAMKGVNPTAYVRIPFNVADASALQSLVLKMKYDDGFIAYLNGTQVAGRNAPTTPAYNSAATAENPDDNAMDDETIDISSSLSLVHTGTNVLAIQAMNVTASDTDFLMSPTLAVTTVSSGLPIEERYFQVPTPGAANSTGVNELGPIVTHVTHSPQIPTDADPLVVTAEVAKATSAITSVVLHYRVNWATSDTNATMYDDGAHGDGAAGDGVYGGIIPASASVANQMVRYYVTAVDSAAHTSRMPLYLVQSGARQSEQYYGTVVSDPNIHTNIPVFQYFIQNVSLADGSGTRGDVFYMGELYDNVFIRVRGSTINSGASTNLSRKIEFNSDHHFLFAAGQGRVNEINLNLPGPGDDTYLRQTMSYWLYDQVDAAGPASYLMHCQQNGTFMGVRVFWQQGDEDELDQQGLDPNGGLYRATASNLSGTGGFEYKTADATQAQLQTLVNGVSLSNANRHTYVMDDLDLAALVNYLAADVIIQDTDSIQTNYYVYQDAKGDGEWQIIPYDRDLTWGSYVGGSSAYVYDDNGDGLNTVAGGAMGPNGMINPMYPDYNYYYLISFRGWNRLEDAVKRDPVASQMFFRRVRTLMDQYLKPTGTPYAQLPLENRLDWWVSQLSNEIANNQVPPQGGSGAYAGISDFKSYLTDLRSYLYGGGIPGFTLDAAQPAAFAQQITIGTLDFDPASGNQDQEYIQLNNPNSYAVDISGWRVTGGVDYKFPDGTVIVGGGSLYLAKDSVAFRARTTGPRGGQGLFVQGGYDGNLSNQGDTIRLVSAADLLIDTKSYGSDSPLINEVMTNNGNGNDWIELYNPTGATVDLSGWHLSDSNTSLARFTIPAGTTLAPSAYLTFSETQLGFGLSKYGDNVYLSNAASVIIDSHDFGGSDFGVSFGRSITNEGVAVFTAMASPTMNFNNAAPAVGPVVINEIMYNPLAGNDEFIELKNATASPVDLYDAAHPADTWTISGGVDYVFPTGMQIPASGLLVLTNADVSTTPLKDAFRAKYSIPSGVQIFGPWQGNLNNGGEDINLNKPGTYDAVDGQYPVVRVDRVEYSPTYPWPSIADGTGKSLERIGPAAFGNDPFSWQSFRNGNPGRDSLLQGDANRDGGVSFADYLVLESNFGKTTGVGWVTADFNNDGKVSFADYLLLEANFGKAVALPSPPPAAPVEAAPLSLSGSIESQPLAAPVSVDLLAETTPASTLKTQVFRGRKLSPANGALDKILQEMNLLA